MSDVQERPGTRSFRQVLADQLKDEEFRAEWERLAPARAVAIRLVRYRAENGLTQTALARLLGMSQPAVARLETGDHVPTLATLIRVSDALDIEFLVDIRPKARRQEWVSSAAHHASVVEHVSTARGGQLLFVAS